MDPLLSRTVELISESSRRRERDLQTEAGKGS
jgi:hypothetical protein